eukprot:GILJ01009706.1.p1 GENE.GILJ01009706.1~~GILJ01009706.1.p1  ORF type:complete len:336 (+),score=3.11 GILJ01009706.1:101-1009(+)
MQTGIYAVWRCSRNDMDCTRVSNESKCFCGHAFEQHDIHPFRRKPSTACQTCPCRQYNFCPSRPEEIGEWWLVRRKGFNILTYRAKCNCKHTHEEHDPNGAHRCRSCRCPSFASNFLCVSCECHYEDHETVFETEEERIRQNKPVGRDFLPLAEAPAIQSAVFGDLMSWRPEDSTLDCNREGDVLQRLRENALSMHPQSVRVQPVQPRAITTGQRTSTSRPLLAGGTKSTMAAEVKRKAVPERRQTMERSVALMHVSSGGAQQGPLQNRFGKVGATTAELPRSEVKKQSSSSLISRNRGGRN